MNHGDVPDFDLIARNPAAFFGLEANFDRKDLRRAYARFIKQFKPETHPAEFQRIRAVYELLDGRLRYGVTAPIVPLPFPSRSKLDVGPDWGTSSLSTAPPTPTTKKEPPTEQRVAPSAKPEAPAVELDVAPPGPPPAAKPEGPAVELEVPPPPAPTAESPAIELEVPPPPASGTESPEIDFDVPPPDVYRTTRRPPPETPPPEPEPPDKKRRASEPTRAPLTLEEWLQTESPRSVYRRLAALDDKSPYDFYALAILADVVTGDRLGFLKWLLSGVKRHPNQPSLMSLLQAYLREDLPEEAIESVLASLVRLIPDDRFFFFTEPLWDRLLRRKSFDAFARAWQTCQGKVRDYRIAGRVAFLIHILRPAMWIADDAWLTEQMAFVNDNSDQLGHHLEFDWEVVCLLYAYRGASRTFASRHPMAARIDKALRDYCLLEESEGLRSFIDCQIGLVRDAQGTMRAFPVPFDSETDRAVLDVWFVIMSDVSEKVGLAPQPDHEERALRPLHSLLRELERSMWRILHRHLVAALIFNALTAALLCAGLFSFLGRMVPAVQLVVVSVTAWALLAALYYGWLKPRVLKRDFYTWRGAQLERHYCAVGRLRIFRLAAALAVPSTVLFDGMRLVLASDSELTLSRRLFELVQEDAGLVVFAAATQFDR